MREFAKALARSESGATAIEYALVAALIAVALSSGFLALGTGVGTYYDDVEAEYSAANR